MESENSGGAPVHRSEPGATTVPETQRAEASFQQTDFPPVNITHTQA